jgi:hypothetical protein
MEAWARINAIDMNKIVDKRAHMTIKSSRIPIEEEIDYAVPIGTFPPGKAIFAT